MVKKSAEKAVEKEKEDLIDSQNKTKNSDQDKEEQVEEITDKDKATENDSDKQTSGQKKKTSAKKKSKEAKQLVELKNKVGVAEESAKEWQDKYMRLSAEFDNYRKRTLKEKADLTKNANDSLLLDIIPVIDDFERGRDNIGKSQDLDGFKKGIELIHTKFVEFLRKSGVKEIEAMEKEFDLDFHEALTKIPAPTDELKGKVVDVIEKGYLLNDKVIRYAKVVVGE